MRDVLLTLVVFGALPFALVRPYVGVLLWTWVSMMNPQRLCWGFAYDFPYAYIIAIVTLVSLLISPEAKRVPWTRETVLLLVFIGWMAITTVFAVYPSLAWPELEKVLKIQLMVYVTLMMMRSRERIDLLIWVIVLSLGFYGVKGGVFTILHGGVYHVMGPARSFIGGNNEMGLALIMTIPLMRYLQLTTSRTLLRFMLAAAMLLCAVAVVGSQSRGAMLGIVAMGAFLWLKSRNKAFTALLGIVAAALILSIMPQAWFNRMGTIQHYQTDASAEGRINAWKMAINLAEARPLGGGFDSFQPGMFARYAPQPRNVHDSHSIFFEVLGEHGFVGLALFLMLGLMVWRTASWVIRRARGDPAQRWAADLAAMLQVSLVGYATAGTFLGLANFDLYYTLIALVVLGRTVIGDGAAAREAALAGPESALQPGGGITAVQRAG